MWMRCCLIMLTNCNRHQNNYYPLTLPGQAVDNLWSDCARWILGLVTIWPTGSCSFFPANANCEKAVWYPGVSSMSIKCSSSGMESSSGNSKRPIRDCSKGVLDWRKQDKRLMHNNSLKIQIIDSVSRIARDQWNKDGHQCFCLSRNHFSILLARLLQFLFWKLFHLQRSQASCVTQAWLVKRLCAPNQMKEIQC